MRAQGEQQRQGGGQLNQAREYLGTGKKLGIFYFIGFTIVIGIRLGYTVHTEEVPATPCRAGEECADARRRPARDDEGAPPCREVGERSRGSAGTWRRLLEGRPAAPLPRWRRFPRGCTNHKIRAREEAGDARGGARTRGRRIAGDCREGRAGH